MSAVDSISAFARVVAFVLRDLRTITVGVPEEDTVDTHPDTPIRLNPFSSCVILNRAFQSPVAIADHCGSDTRIFTTLVPVLLPDRESGDTYFAVEVPVFTSATVASS